MPIRISGVLKNGLGKPIPNCTIELKSKKTTLSVIATTEADQLVDVIGSYIMDVEPGEYSVSLCITGFPRKPVGDIQVYSDSRPGTLNDFLMMPDESDLTPELVLIFQQLRDEAKQAANEATVNKELTNSILSDALKVQVDVNEKQRQVNADMVETDKYKGAAATFAKSTSEDVEKTTADVATVSGLKTTAEAAVQQAELSNLSASNHAGRAEVAANSVKTLTASAGTLAPDENATAQWNSDTNNLLIGVPKGLKGDKGEKGEQGIQGAQGIQGVQGIKGDVGPIGPPVTLSPLLTSMAGLTTAANQLIYSNGVNTVMTTSFPAFGRSIIAVPDATAARTTIGAAADSDVLKKDNDLSEISTPTAKVNARSNLGLGTAAVMDIGVLAGDVMEVGAFGIGNTTSKHPPGGASDFKTNWGGLYSGMKSSIAGVSGAPESGVSYQLLNVPGNSTPGGTLQIAVNEVFGKAYIRANYNWNWRELWCGYNAAVDTNGFIKRASPIVKLFGNGFGELNEESAGVTTERLSEGVYRLSGSLMGFHSDGAWDIEVPNDDNKQPIIWVNSAVEANGDIIVKTYHRTHPNAPKFAQNNISGYVDGDPIDIPVGRWLDLRVQVYNDEQSYDISEK